jgi:pilus assembly protein CpaB
MAKYKSSIMFGIAILLALVATVLVINWLQQKSQTEAAVPLETQEVAVAKVDLSWGTELSQEMIETKPFLKTSLPAGYFSDISSLVGRVLVSSVMATEPILESRLAPVTAKAGGVAAIVSPDKRAIAIKADKVIGVSGFIHPGNRVDVLVTIDKEAGRSFNKTVTKTILENILVLASGQEMVRKGKKEESSPVDVITLEVTLEEAEKLALAATEGKILLVLRNFNDTKDVLTKGTTIPALLRSYYGSRQGTKTVTAKKVMRKQEATKVEAREIEKSVEIQQPSSPKPSIFKVELIKGTKISELKFEKE